MVTVITRLHNYATRLGSVGAIVAVITFIPVFWPTQEGDPAAAYAAVEGDDTGQVTSPDIKNTTVVQREPDVDQRDPADVTLIKTQQAIVDKLVDQLSADDQLNNEQVREAIADAVSGLAETDGEPSDIERAEQALADGKTELAMDLYRADALSKLEQGEAQLQAAAASYRRLGALAYLDDSDTVLEAYQIAVSLWPDDTDAWNQLGNLYGLDGELDDETFDFRETMIAKGYANLGLIYQSSGELDRAIELLEKALVIDKELGYKDVIASDYANLASVYHNKGDLDRAIELYEKSLAIEKELDHKEGMASDYARLGSVYHSKGDLDRAIELYEKSLAIEKELGHKEGMASDYTNLGRVYQTKGEWDRAIELHEKALAIDKELGHKEGMAINYGNLGIIYQTKGKWDRAIELHEKSLAIEKELGHEEGMAYDYASLGMVYHAKGEFDRAREYWEKSVELYDAIGSPLADEYRALLSMSRLENRFVWILNKLFK